MKTKHLSVLMAKHMAALAAKLATNTHYEKREEATIEGVAKAVDQIANTFNEYKKVNDDRLKALSEGKSTADFEAKLAKMDEQFDKLTQNMEEQRKRGDTLETRLVRPGQDGKSAEQLVKEAVEYRDSFMSYLRKPKDFATEQRMLEAGQRLEQRDKADGREARATQVVTTSNSAGGYLLPREIESQIYRLGVETAPMRTIATVRQVGTTDYTELFDVGGAGFEWVGEDQDRAETDSPNLGARKPTMGTISARPRATEESMDDLSFDVQAWLVDSVRETFGVGENQAFVGGNGINKPTGFLAGPAPVAAPDATRTFGVLQYIPSGQAAALPTNPDVYLDMVYSVRPRYRNGARWVVSRAVLSSMRKMKDTTGAYMWQPAITAGEPSSFLGYPVTEMEDMPGVAANSFPVAFGNFKEGYLIVDRVGLRVTRDEITRPGYVKFYIRKRVGGIVRNSQAIRVMKIATA